jgi:hypothetical protein
MYPPNKIFILREKDCEITLLNVDITTFLKAKIHKLIHIHNRLIRLAPQILFLFLNSYHLQ